jgi:hypothetical protein
MLARCGLADAVSSSGFANATFVSDIAKKAEMSEVHRRYSILENPIDQVTIP